MKTRNDDGARCKVRGFLQSSVSWPILIAFISKMLGSTGMTGRKGNGREDACAASTASGMRTRQKLIAVRMRKEVRNASKHLEQNVEGIDCF